MNLTPGRLLIDHAFSLHHLTSNVRKENYLSSLCVDFPSTLRFCSQITDFIFKFHLWPPRPPSPCRWKSPWNVSWCSEGFCLAQHKPGDNARSWAAHRKKNNNEATRFMYPKERGQMSPWIGRVAPVAQVTSVLAFPPRGAGRAHQRVTVPVIKCLSVCLLHTFGWER